MHLHRGVAILGMQHDAIQMKNAILRNSPVVPVLTVPDQAGRHDVNRGGMQYRETALCYLY